MSLIAIFDGTRFYASCAAVYQPELRERPVVVLSGKDGIIIAANRRATDLGIKKFGPIFEYKTIIERNNVAVVDANFDLFGGLSRCMHTVLERALPVSHIYSIDECFADISGIPDPLQFMVDLRRQVYKETRLPIGAAASLNCTLAKVASWCAKKVPGYKGICVLDNIEQIDKVLDIMPVSELWGVGKASTAKLQIMGIHTAMQLKQVDLKKIQRDFGKPLVNLIRELHGNKILSWRQLPEPKQQIFSSRSKRDRIHNAQDLQQAISFHIHEVCEKARKQQSNIKTIQYFCNTSAYDQYRHSASINITLDYPSNDTIHFLKLLAEHMPQLLPNGTFIPIYKFGVGAISLTDARFEQVDLFAPKHDERLMQALDGLNIKFGRRTMFLASQGTKLIGERFESKQLRNVLTRWSDIPIIHC